MDLIEIFSDFLEEIWDTGFFSDSILWATGAISDFSFELDELLPTCFLTFFDKEFDLYDSGGFSTPLEDLDFKFEDFLSDEEWLELPDFTFEEVPETFLLETLFSCFSSCTPSDFPNLEDTLISSLIPDFSSNALSSE